MTIPCPGRHRSHTGRALGRLLILAMLVVHGTLQASVAVAGGQITPVSSPGSGYVNDNAHAFPYMVFLPAGYSSSGTSHPLVFCLHGNGEVGNGSSDGSLNASDGNQLARVFGSGPLPLIKNGSTYFGDQRVIVVQPQSDLADGSAFNSNRVDLTMRHVLNTYNVDRDRIYTMGLSAGGGGLARYAYSYGTNSNYRLAVVVPIANSQGRGTTYNDFSKMTGAVTWFIGTCDDTVTPFILSSGRLWSGFGDGWAGGLSRYIDQATDGGAVPDSSAKARCLTTHPDVASITAGNFNTDTIIPTGDLSGTYTGRYNPTNPVGWTWVAGQTSTTGSRLQITLRRQGGHSGWHETFGTGSSPNLPFWTWVLSQRLGQTTTVEPPGVENPASGPGSTTGRSVMLSVLGRTAAGEGILSYTWSTAGSVPASVTFTPNGNNAAKNTTVTFTKAGAYHFQVMITNTSNGATTLSGPFTTTVTQAGTSVIVTPSPAAIPASTSATFLARARDQFGNFMTTQPSFVWALSGGGTVDQNGLFTSGAQPQAGPFSLSATSAGMLGEATISVSTTGGTGSGGNGSTGTASAAAGGGGGGGGCGMGSALALIGTFLLCAMRRLQ